MRIKYEISAGGLLVRPLGPGYEALLIGRRSPRIWTLPKGHVERWESHEQAAIREVREETGCWGEIVARLNEISFWFYVGKAKHRKSVTFYLMRFLSGEPQNEDHEVEECRWFEIGAARRTLKYVNEKRLVDLATEYLLGHPDAFGEPPSVAPAVEQKTS